MTHKQAVFEILKEKVNTIVEGLPDSFTLENNELNINLSIKGSEIDLKMLESMLQKEAPKSEQVSKIVEEFDKNRISR